MSDHMTQIDFGDLPDDMTEGFWVYHQENPDVFDRLVELSESLVSRGRTRIGMSMLFEILRWEYFMAVDTAEPFKLNNNYRAYYTRLIEKKVPELRGVFTKRQSVSDSAVAA